MPNTRCRSISRSSEFSLARWISSDDRKKLEAFIAANGSGIADDVDGDPVFLAKNEFYLGYTRERAEGIVFSSVKDVKKKGVGACVRRAAPTLAGATRNRDAERGL